jgi:hypothetical protein
MALGVGPPTALTPTLSRKAGEGDPAPQMFGVGTESGVSKVVPNHFC